MTTGETQPLGEEQFRSLVNKLDQASQSLTERERAFVIEAFKEGVASDEGDVQGYVQMVETAAGDITPIAVPLSQEERQELRQKLATIGEQLTPEERGYVHAVFARGTGSLDEVQGYGLYYSFTQQGVVTGWTTGSGGVGTSITVGDPTTTAGAVGDAEGYLALNQVVAAAVVAY